jgi:hypothetical protein
VQRPRATGRHLVKGTRLVLTNSAGEVTVRSWDQDKVRIQATHGARETVDAQTILVTTNAYGARWLLPTLIPEPRILQFGVQVTYWPDPWAGRTRLRLGMRTTCFVATVIACAAAAFTRAAPLGRRRSLCLPSGSGQRP